MLKVFIIDKGFQNFETTFSNNFILIIASITLITAAGYIINDYYDIEIDKINKPDEVIIDKFISGKVALAIYFALNTAAILLIFLVTKQLAIIFILCITSLWYYSYYLKKKPIIGNLMVAILSAMSLLVLDIYYHKESKFIGLYAYFAFGVSLIREIVKDVEDLEGDKQNNCKTIPIVWGIPKTITILKAISLLYFLSLICLTYYFSISFGIYWTALLMSFGYFYFKLSKASNSQSFAQLSLILKIIMLIGVLSIIFV